MFQTLGERALGMVCVTVIAVVFLAVNPFMPRTFNIVVGPPPSAPGGPPVPADFPTVNSVGPTVDPTITYGGSCTITTDDLVIEDRIINCTATGVEIAAGVEGLIIRNSIVNGGITTDFDNESVEANDNNHPTVFTIESSRVFALASGVNRPVNVAHFNVYDSELKGDASGGWAHNKVIIEDSYIHTAGNSSHQSGLRMQKNSTLRNNTIFCTPFPESDDDQSGPPFDVDGGCSADAVFYREPEPTINLTVEHNYFPADPDIFPFNATRWIDCNSPGVTDCLGNTFTGNLFDLGPWGTDAGEFPDDATNTWEDNWWVDGVPALRDEVR